MSYNDRRAEFDAIIDNIRREVPLSRVIVDLGGVEKSGGRFICPVCARKHGAGYDNPGYTIMPGREVGGCHAGCDVAGDVFTLSLKMNRALGTYYKAVSYIVDMYGSSYKPEWEALLAGARAEGSGVRLAASDVYEDLFIEARKDIDDDRVKAYCEGRGITTAMLDEFEGCFIGDAAIIRFKSKYEEGTYFKVLVNLNLYNMRNRLAFPVRNEEGKIISFNARYLEIDDRPSAKWIKSLGKGYKVRNAYVNEFSARWSNVDKKTDKKVVLVEGIFDAMVLQEQFKHKVHVIPLIGADIPIELIRRLALYLEVVVFLDGDKGGDNGVFNAYLRNAPGLNVSVARLPEGLDPAEASYKENLAALKGKVPIRDYIVGYIQDLVENSQEADLGTMLSKCKKLEARESLVFANIMGAVFNRIDDRLKGDKEVAQ